MRRKLRAPLLILVEPDGFWGTILKTKLESEGYAAEVVPTPKRLFTLLTRKEPKGILLEMSVGAVTVLEQLHADPKFAAVPVVVTSPYASREDIESAKRAGAKTFIITTQTTPAELVQTLTRYFEK